MLFFLGSKELVHLSRSRIPPGSFPDKIRLLSVDRVMIGTAKAKGVGALHRNIGSNSVRDSNSDGG